MGRALPKTFELLVGKGTLFTSSIATTPLCCPSRATLLTGQYGHNNGVLRNKCRALLAKRNVLPAWLGAAGYTTAHVGRWLNAYETSVELGTEVAPGWDKWQTLIAPRRFYDYELSSNGKRVPFGVSDDSYLTRVLNRKSAQITKRLAAKEAPFYLQVDHMAPHRGTGGPDEGCRIAAISERSPLSPYRRRAL